MAKVAEGKSLKGGSLKLGKFVSQGALLGGEGGRKVLRISCNNGV